MMNVVINVVAAVWYLATGVMLASLWRNRRAPGEGIANGFEALGRNQVSQSQAFSHRCNMIDQKLWELQQLIVPSVVEPFDLGYEARLAEANNMLKVEKERVQRQASTIRGQADALMVMRRDNRRADVTVVDKLTGGTKDHV